MKITNTPKQWSKNDWPDFISLDNGNIYYCGELKSRCIYYRSPGSEYELYMTTNGQNYTRVEDGEIITPAMRNVFGPREYKVHVALVRSNIIFTPYVSHKRGARDFEGLNYSQIRDIRITLEAKDISKYIGVCRAKPTIRMDKLLEEECTRLCKSESFLKYRRSSWMFMISKALNRYGVTCVDVISNVPEEDYFSVSHNKKEQNKRREEEINVNHTVKIDEVKTLSGIDTKVEGDKRKAEGLREIMQILGDFSFDEIATLKAVFTEQPELLKEIIRNKKCESFFNL